jgi:hypothetical protein
MKVASCIFTDAALNMAVIGPVKEDAALRDALTLGHKKG